MFDSKTVKPSNIVRVDIDDADALYAAYMPFIANGGLFVHGDLLTHMNCGLGTDIYLLLQLKAENERLPVHGRVVWLSPSKDHQRGADTKLQTRTRMQLSQLAGNAAGAGVQFRDKGEVQRRIEGLLAGMINSERRTLTL